MTNQHRHRVVTLHWQWAQSQSQKPNGVQKGVFIENTKILYVDSKRKRSTCMAYETAKNY